MKLPPSPRLRRITITRSHSRWWAIRTRAKPRCSTRYRLRAKTANFPGTTVERKVGRLHLGHEQIVVVDLPGLYSLDSTVAG